MTISVSLLQAKFNATCLEREDIREHNSKMQAEIYDLKESLDRRVASNQIEVRLIMFNTYIHIHFQIVIIFIKNVVILDLLQCHIYSVYLYSAGGVARGGRLCHGRG